MKKEKEIKVEVIFTEGYKERFVKALVEIAEKHLEVRNK